MREHGGHCFKLCLQWVRGLQGIGEEDLHARAVLGKGVTRFSELEANLHMGDGVRGHHQLKAIKARQQMVAHIHVPAWFEIVLGEAIVLAPLRLHVAMDEVDDFDQEGGGAGGGVEDLDEGGVCGAVGG